MEDPPGCNRPNAGLATLMVNSCGRPAVPRCEPISEPFPGCNDSPDTEFLEATRMSFDATRTWGWTRWNGQGSHADAGRGAPATPSRKRARASRPSMEVLEDRIALATFLVVNSLDGPGRGPTGSLRD